jgi:hypothetical protein
MLMMSPGALSDGEGWSLWRHEKVRPAKRWCCRIEQMGVSNESRIGRAIGFAIIVIAIFVVGAIWRPDNAVQGQVGAQEDRIEAGS